MTLALGVLVASLLGSLHCAAMCGGFVCLYASRAEVSWRTHATYHLARLGAYVSFGFLAGALGGMVDAAGGELGIGRVAAVGSGVLLMLWGVGRLLRFMGVRRGGNVAGDLPLLRRAQSQLLNRSRAWLPVWRAGVVGLVSGLLPCGWLYAFVAAAAGTGHVSSAMLVMGMFWLGTVPALAGAALVVQRLAGPLRARLPVVSAVVVIVLGAVTVAGRLTPLLTGQDGQATPHVMSHARPG